MGDWTWNWEDIVVASGAWWIAMIGLVLVIVSLLVGAWLGYRKAVRDHREWPETLGSSSTFPNN